MSGQQYDFNKLDSIPISPPDNHDDTPGEDLKNNLRNQILQEQIARDQQRREHRSYVVGLGIIACFCSYIIFTLLAFKIYADLGLLKELSIAWAIPFFGLLAMPTIFLAILVMCLYRDRPNTSPDTIVQALTKVLTQSIKH